IRAGRSRSRASAFRDAARGSRAGACGRGPLSWPVSWGCARPAARLLPLRLQDGTEASMTAPSPAPYEVRARNGAAASENKIHDNTVAQRFGFRGALVPGVEVFAYMAHVPVAHFGRAWLEQGAVECRFLKPVYDGDIARVTATAEGDGLALAVESAGERCATGRASLPAPRPAPAIDSLPAGIPPAERPPASEATLGEGRALGIAPMVIDRAALAAYLAA